MENMQCHSDKKGSPPKVLKQIAIAVFVIGGGYYLWMQHRAHVLQYLPFAFFLLCPLMHFFGGHGHHGQTKENNEGGHHHE